MLTVEQRLDRLEMINDLKDYPTLDHEKVSVIRDIHGCGIIPARKRVMLDMFEDLDTNQNDSIITMNSFFGEDGNYQEMPLQKVLEIMTDEWIYDGQYCDENVIELRDACKKLLSMMSKNN